MSPSVNSHSKNITRCSEAVSCILVVTVNFNNDMKKNGQYRTTALSNRVLKNNGLSLLLGANK